jgi:iron complex outermembrane receptor protein
MKLPISALRRVLLTMMVVSLFSAGAVFAQSIKVTGKVTDAKTGESIPGVNVLVKGTSTGMATDMDGKFSLTAPKGSVVTFSFIGYAPLEVPITSNVLNVQLSPMTEKIDEVVVIGYGSTKVKDATGSLEAVSSKSFTKGMASSPQELISGKLSGVTVTNNGGSPTASPTIRIRGGSSISASNDPLIVIDGVPIDNNGISGVGNALQSINPNDIESMTVLKDASSTAIYGARASNGVIIITTKKGRSGFNITFETKNSISSPTKTLDVLSSKELLSIAKTQFAGNSQAMAIINAADPSVNTDWQDEILRNAFGTDNNLSIAGKKGFLPYRVSVGYTKQDGIVKTSQMDRTTMALNLSPTFLNNTLTVNLNVKGSYIENRFNNGGAINDAVLYDPTKKPKSADPLFAPYGGYFTWLDNTGKPLKFAYNPVSQLEQLYDKGYAWRSTGNLQVDYKIPVVEGLKAVLNLGYDYSKSNGRNFAPENAAFVYYEGGRNNFYNQNKRNQLLDFYMNYVREFEFLKSKVDATAGYSWQHFWNSGGNDLSNIKGTPESIKHDSYKNENFLISFFGRVTYSIYDKYILTGTLRRDGSSRFIGDNKWGLFPSGALAWKIDQEEIFKNIDVISTLKLRLGYGVTGQQDIPGGNYPALARYTLGKPANSYPMAGTWYQTLTPAAYDANIKWEETESYNIGLDFGFLKNRISGSIDAYYKYTSDLINEIPIPAGTNFSDVLITNVGNFESRGLDFNLNAQVINEKDLTWSLGYVLNYNKTNVKKLTLLDDPNYAGLEVGGIAGAQDNKIQIHAIDHPLYSFYVLKQVYDKNGKPIEGLYEDLNGDGQINGDDRYIYKSPVAPVTMGINSSLNYKSWFFNFSGRLSLGNYVYNNVASKSTYSEIFPNNLGFLQNLPTSTLKTGFKTLTSTLLKSDYFVENASFFKMDYITLGYTFDNLFRNKGSLVVTGTVQNAFVISNYNGLNPEVFSGIDNSVYPTPRIFVLGLTFSF